MARQFGSTASYKALVDEKFRSPLARAFFYGFPSYGGQSYDGKAAGAFLIPYYMLTRGVFYPEGGVAEIPIAMARLARELGVEIREECQVTGLKTHGRRVTAVALENSEALSADLVISNVDRSTTRGWFRDGDVVPAEL